MKVNIWLPPADDHAAWQKMTGAEMTREELESAASEAAKAAMEAGHEPQLIGMPVAVMQSRLLGRENTPANRAAVLVGDDGGPYRRGRTLGLRLADIPGTRQQAVGWALIEDNQRPAKKSDQAVGPDGVAGAVRQILRGL